MKIFKFDSGEEMLAEIRRGTDLYAPAEGMYVFEYNEAGAVCCYSIDNEEAIELENKARDTDDYWGAFLGWGGGIYDDPSDEYNPPEPGFSNIDFCNDTYQCEWIRTCDVLEYFEND